MTAGIHIAHGELPRACRVTFATVLGEPLPNAITGLPAWLSQSAPSQSVDLHTSISAFQMDPFLPSAGISAGGFGGEQAHQEACQGVVADLYSLGE